MNRIQIIAVAVALLLGAYFLAGGGAEAPGTADEAQLSPGALAQVTVPAQLSPDAQIGARAFSAKCSECHGENAVGADGKGPPLVHKIYEPSHHGDAAFFLAARNGVVSHHWPFGNMMPVDGITEAEIGYIVAYIRELQKENGIF